MDTDDLSNKAYKGIILEAEKFSHDLTLQFALLSDKCEDEKQYLQKARARVAEIQQADEVDLDDIFFGNIPDKTYCWLL